MTADGTTALEQETISGVTGEAALQMDVRWGI